MLAVRELRGEGGEGLEMWFSRETCSEQKLSFMKLHEFSFQYNV